MTYKVIITPDAIQNIDDALVYYKFKASAKVARDFIEDYRKTLKDIQKTKYFQIFFDDFRGKPMKKFPYIVFIPSMKNVNTLR
ncbi:MAG: hypothetical protein QM535_11840 [Limnohabitans sp.]|nr:hypothetical protein [Limnohabitans sp.]